MNLQTLMIVTFAGIPFLAQRLFGGGDYTVVGVFRLESIIAVWIHGGFGKLLVSERAGVVAAVIAGAVAMYLGCSLSWAFVWAIGAGIGVTSAIEKYEMNQVIADAVAKGKAAEMAGRKLIDGQKESEYGA